MDRLNLILNRSIAPILGLEPHEITNEVYDKWRREHPPVEIDHSKLNQNLLPLGIRNRSFISQLQWKEIQERADRFLDQFSRSK